MFNYFQSIYFQLQLGIGTFSQPVFSATWSKPQSVALVPLEDDVPVHHEQTKLSVHGSCVQQTLDTAYP